MTRTLSSPAEDRQIDAAVGRGYLYLWLSRAFRYPDPDLAGNLKEPALTLLEGSLDLLPEASREPLRPVLAELRAAVTDHDLPQLQSDHRQVFGHIESSPCPPYETRYGSSHLFQQTQLLSDIAGFYRAFGLDLSDGAHERPDHLAVELEFLHFLCLKEAHALEHHGSEQVELCRDAQVKFLRDHLLPWAPSFARRLQQAAGDGFYQRLGALMAAFLSTEAGRSGCHRTEEAVLQPIAYSPEGCSFSCGQDQQGADDLISER